MTVFVARALDAVKDALNSSSKTVTIVLFDPSPHPAEGYVSFYSEESPVDNLARAELSNISALINRTERAQAQN